MRNKIRERLENGEVSIGSWLNMASPMAAELMISAGYDWLAVDAEHGPVDLSLITDMFRAIESRGGTPIVRVWDDQPQTIGRVLDAGAMGVVVPHVSTVDQAQSIADSCRYPPLGRRSMGGGRARMTDEDYPNWANDEVVVIPQIEDREGIENAEAIVSLEGIDIGFLGPSDLALDMNVEPGSEEHEAALQSFLDACRKVNKPAGIPVNSGEAVHQRQAQGFVFFDLSSDVQFLKQEAARQLEEAKGE